ncbi:MAG: hypothetical protein A2051_03240 [Desulfovibrionales bacterium GWA2_65_9]|nr:MAG: hypothetical protein A2051_03240 [Desulfovibrionales bacterium GWA2_65_9]
MTRRIILASFLVFSLLVVSFSVAQASHRGPDSIITANVEEALEKGMPATPDGMASYTIDVYTIDGVVTLRGKMQGMDHVKMAGEIAKKVAGVKSVKNNISVKASK